jgi:hypothetical protein
VCFTAVWQQTKLAAAFSSFIYMEYDDDIFPNIIDIASPASYSSRFSLRRKKFATLAVYNICYKCCYIVNIRRKHILYHHNNKKTKSMYRICLQTPKWPYLTQKIVHKVDCTSDSKKFCTKHWTQENRTMFSVDKKPNKEIWEKMLE